MFDIKRWTTSLISLFLLSHTVKPSFAFLIASDTIILYENGQRITDSSVMYDKYNYSPSCKGGICHIQQGYNPITFYKTKELNVLNYEEWCESNTCNSDLHDNYLDALKRTAIYSTTITIPGSAENKERTFALDLKKDTITLLGNPAEALMAQINPLYTMLTGGVVLVSLLLIGKKYYSR